MRQRMVENAVETRRGTVRLPAYMPVTTWGGEFPLDAIVRPFLGRVAQMVMVSAHYAREMPESFRLPTFVDSGGFAALRRGARVEERQDGTAEIVTVAENGDETRTTPEDVLELQKRVADFGCPLDFPIPMAVTDREEREKRLRMTLANAKWASKQGSQGELRLFGAVQGWDIASYVRCAQELKDMGYLDLAIGGLVQRVGRPDELRRIVGAVADVVCGDGMLHCFGIGEPRLVAMLVEAGATSVDSSSYVRAAVSGRRWDGVAVPLGASPLERCEAALGNLEFAIKAMAGEIAKPDSGVDDECPVMGTAPY